MEPLIIAQTDDTPAIHLDLAGGKFEFSGKSLPEDVTTFYAPVFDWLKKYEEEAEGENTFAFKMSYFNTASSKIILDILMRLEEIHEGGKPVNIAWYFEEDDEDMEEAGEEYSEIVEELTFKLIEMED
jgi:hypothetical protein